MKISNLNEVISFNSSFKTAINLYLSLNNTEKVLNYIPTKSSVYFMDEYLEAVIEEKEHATLFVGPYGKGKSHLLLVLLAILSLERNKENEKVIKQLKKSISNVEEIGTKTVTDIEKVWESKRFLPVIINDTKGELNQAFLSALDDALKRDGLDSLVPDTYYSEALRRIKEWEKEYPDTFVLFKNAVSEYEYDVKSIRAGLKQFETKALEVFKEVYPSITAGSMFNPLAESEVLPLYKSVSDKLVEFYDYDGIYIVFDEFSKFIEGLEGTRAGNSMKLIQDMCELAEDSSNAQIYMTMVAHKSIKEYGKYLSADIINAFTGIEGRIVEKFFITSSKNNYELIRSAIIKDKKLVKDIPGIDKYFDEKASNYYSLPAFKTNFNVEDFNNVILNGCYPLNPIASYLLMNVSEKVAQNERTLFTFISNDEPYSLARYIKEHEATDGWVVGADLVYDYFSSLFKKEVSNELVHNIWLNAEYALSKCDDVEEKKLIKTLALFQIVNKGDEIPATTNFLSLGANLIDNDKTTNSLSEKKLIYLKSSLGAYVFKTKAGTELRTELKKQREIKGDNCNYPTAIQKITGKYYVVPRKYNTKKMMTRYFIHEYMNVEVFLSISDANVFFDDNASGDGKVITLYGTSKFTVKEIKEHYKNLACNRLVVVVPKKTIKQLRAIKDYEILQEIKNNSEFIQSNAVLKKEIPLLEEDIVKKVEDEIEDVYSTDSINILYFQNNKVKSVSKESAEDVVNICCDEVYSKTPIINNEIINRTFITSSQTKKARLNIIEAIMNGEDDEDFYSGTNQEATIYRALFEISDVAKFDIDNNISKIQTLIDEFVNRCCDKKVKLSVIVNKLMKPPYGMRLGVIPVYLAKVLSARNEDLIVYFLDTEVQLAPEIIVNMCVHSEEYSLFVSKADIQKEDYIKKLNDLFEVESSRALTENRIKNIVICMQRWFRSLPQISRNLASIDELQLDEDSKHNMMVLKQMMQKVDPNPYEILFVSLPDEFEKTELSDTYDIIKQCHDLYQSYLDKIVKKVIDGIYSIWGERKKNDLYHLLKEWYEKQSSLSKQGLHSGSITNFMSCIERMDAYSDEEVAQRVVKAVTNVYVDNWLDSAYDDFIEEITNIKSNIEQIQDESEKEKLLLSFVGSKGETIERYYERVDEGTGSILRNIIEDTLDEYDDLSVNDRVAILLEMIEKIIG